eukprot:CAMPEP_0194066902 /NCGR_PEP_ID=MMETSP0009_2-20130614/86274_1 /TAXON_ID=210454 /ORGANISM="Grammatophora oceanica, Strain CCMP 410" /LENGTH=48 /DNA_ID= /DNA_START= /DNA_END= /DNA_ORIENTATION=
MILSSFVPPAEVNNEQPDMVMMNGPKNEGIESKSDAAKVLEDPKSCEN